MYGLYVWVYGEWLETLTSGDRDIHYFISAGPVKF